MLVIVPPARTGTVQRPTYADPGVRAAAASACSRPSCQEYVCPLDSCFQSGGVPGLRPAGGFSGRGRFR